MKKNYTHMAIVLDRSGSMASIRAGTIEGFNGFLTSQKGVPGEATISLYQFDDIYETVYENANIKNAVPLDNHSFQPRGSTALLDAIGITIDKVGNQLYLLPEELRPEHVLIVIQTDGFENASRKFGPSEIGLKIQHQKDKYNWNFVFLGANQDAILTAGALNIDKNSSLTYASTDLGVQAMYASAGGYTSALRTVGIAAFTEEDRKSAVNDTSVTTS